MKSGTIDTLNLKHIGLLELLFASYPITSGYLLGRIPMTVLMLVIMDILALFRNKERIQYKPLLYLCLFVLIHEFILKLLVGTGTAHLYNMIQYFVVFLSIYIIPSALDYKKMEGSLNWMAIISMVGIVYHFVLIQAGQSVHPIHFPFMPNQGADARIFELGNRPVSFFWEPSAYVSFMIIPLFLSLFKKNILWSVIITSSIFLSTSTNGIIFSIVLILVYLLTQDISKKYRLLISVVGFGLVVFLVSSPLFEAGIEKINNTNFEENVRIVNGPNIVANMPADHLIFGIPFANIDEYNAAGIIHYDAVGNYDSAFVSTFWLVWIKLGIVGLLLFCYALFSFYRRRKDLLPLIITLFVSYFSQGNFFGNMYAFDMIFILAFIYLLPHEDDEYQTVS